MCKRTEKKLEKDKKTINKDNGFQINWKFWINSDHIGSCIWYCHQKKQKEAEKKRFCCRKEEKKSLIGKFEIEIIGHQTGFTLYD